MEFMTREDLLDYAAQIEGKTFGDFDINQRLANEKNKGSLGQIIEEGFFGYDINSNHAPDFEHLGIELKVTPYKKNKNGSISAKERLVLTIINYMEEVHATFETSSFYQKCQEMLLIFYRWDQALPASEYEINKAILFSFSETDLEIIKQDFEIIIGKIRAGLAHELSEADTNYLSACTKGANSSSLRQQPYSDTLAMQRAYALKASYMTHYLRTVIFQSEHLENVLTPQQLKKHTFAELLEQKFTPYIGWTQAELCDHFQIQLAPKQANALIVSHILGIKGNSLAEIDEFAKANISFKTITLKPNGIPQESMAFHTIDFMQLVEQTWFESRFRETLASTKFLFAIFGYHETARENPNRDLYFQGVRLWNMPLAVLDDAVRKMWEATQETVTSGVQFVPTAKGISNNLPGSDFNGIAHVRPKARNAADKTPLPNGDMITKQCFWLNNTYIAEVIK